jgi:16S rRNA processing protein RimM
VSETVVLAAVIAAHGLKGEVRVKTFTETPEGLGGYGVLSTADGKQLTVTSVRPAKNGEAIVTFAEIADRTDAEKLKGLALSVPREALPALDAQEFYHADLIGLRAEDGEGRIIGLVSAVHNYGAGDVIELQKDDGDHVLLAFTRENVPTIDLENRRIVVAVPEDADFSEREHGE